MPAYNSHMEEFLGCCLGRLVLWLILLPVSYIVATPFIWLLAFVGRERYIDNVMRYYENVTRFWYECNFLIW
jgi:hypothetical protein